MGITTLVRLVQPEKAPPEMRVMVSGILMLVRLAHPANASPPKFEVNEERWTHWLKVGAQPSETVAGLKKKIKPAAPVAKA